MNNVAVADVMKMHDRIIEVTGGLLGVRDHNLLESALNKPQTHLFGVERYEDVFSKAGALLEALAMYHPFNDGNKRTAMAAADMYLFFNGVTVTFSSEEYETFMLEVVRKRLSVDKIAGWFRAHQVVAQP